MNWLKCLGLAGVLIIHSVQGANILMLHTLASYSHKVSMYPVADSLASRGHNVTYLSGLEPMSKPNPKVLDIFVRPVADLMDSSVEDDFNFRSRSDKTMPSIADMVYPMELKVCEMILTSIEFKSWLDTTPKVDLVIQDWVGECGLAIAHKLGAKLVLYNTLPFNEKYTAMLGLTQESGVTDVAELYIPSDYDSSSFMARMNLIVTTLGYEYKQYQAMSQFEEMCKTALGMDNFPSMYDLYQNVSLVLQTGNYISELPRSLPPMFVSVPALHVKETKKDVKLPKEMEDFINSRNPDGTPSEGFIYISLGTVVRVADLPEKIRKSFWKTIEAFPKIKFLWRWSGEFPKEKPDNLYVAKWFPQQDILGHPKIRGFVTQAGRPSVQEALSNGVPMIAFPVIADQDFNSMRLEEIGAGVRLELGTVKENEFIQAINTLLYNETFKGRNKEVGALFQDLPMKPRDTVIWWLEYVLRHDNLTHLKPMGRGQTWYQRRMLDVWFAIFILGVVTVLTVLAAGGLTMKYLLHSNDPITAIISKNNGFVKHKAS